MKNDRSVRLSRVAGILLIISGITHVSQLFVYAHSGHVIGAALFGVVYLAIGIGALVKKNLVMLWICAVLPSIGACLGVYRFLYLQPNPFSVFHVCIDLIVVPIFIYSIFTCSKLTIP